MNLATNSQNSEPQCILHGYRPITSKDLIISLKKSTNPRKNALYPTIINNIHSSFPSTVSSHFFQSQSLTEAHFLRLLLIHCYLHSSFNFFHCSVLHDILNIFHHKCGKFKKNSLLLVILPMRIPRCYVCSRAWDFMHSITS